MTEPTLHPEAERSERRIQFVETVPPGDAALLRFDHPTPRHAVLSPSPSRSVGTPASDDLQVTVLPPSDATGTAFWLEDTNTPDAAPALSVRFRGVELWWRPGRALLQCDPAHAEPLLLAIAEFTHYEAELRRIEAEVSSAWTELEEDKALAFEVTPSDLRRTKPFGARMANTFQRRIRLARMEPHLDAPAPTLSASAQKLGEALREQARIEARLETLDGQIEVFEHIYEMASQRIGEFQAARQGNIMEWVIIVLLAAELLAMLVQIPVQLRH